MGLHTCEAHRSEEDEIDITLAELDRLQAGLAELDARPSRHPDEYKDYEELLRRFIQVGYDRAGKYFVGSGSLDTGIGKTARQLDIVAVSRSVPGVSVRLRCGGEAILHFEVCYRRPGTSSSEIRDKITKDLALLKEVGAQTTGLLRLGETGGGLLEPLHEALHDPDVDAPHFLVTPELVLERRSGFTTDDLNPGGALEMFFPALGRSDDHPLRPLAILRGLLVADSEASEREPAEDTSAQLAWRVPRNRQAAVFGPPPRSDAERPDKLTATLAVCTETPPERIFFPGRRGPDREPLQFDRAETPYCTRHHAYTYVRGLDVADELRRMDVSWADLRGAVERLGADAPDSVAEFAVERAIAGHHFGFLRAESLEWLELGQLPIALLRSGLELVADTAVDEVLPARRMMGSPLDRTAFPQLGAWLEDVAPLVFPDLSDRVKWLLERFCRPVEYLLEDEMLVVTEPVVEWVPSGPGQAHLVVALFEAEDGWREVLDGESVDAWIGDLKEAPN